MHLRYWARFQRVEREGYNLEGGREVWEGSRVWTAGELGCGCVLAGLECGCLDGRDGILLRCWAAVVRVVRLVVVGGSDGSGM